MRVDKITLLGMAVVSVTVAGIWWPEIRHNWVRTPHYSAASLQSLRTQPSAALLAKLAKIQFEPDEQVLGRDATIFEAERILKGEWNQPAFGIRPIHLPFDAGDLQYGWPTQQLNVSSLQHIETILDAYELTTDERFLKAARDAINAWAAYESKAILSPGYLWNDHAIAQRILVLTKYWSLIRDSSLLDQRSTESVAMFIGRSGHLLAKPEQFTVRTNHGFMQNLALLHIAASFPALPDSAMFRAVAIDRLRTQLGFYQSDEGVILEHSVGYHELGTNLLAILNQYTSVLDPVFSREVGARRDKACRYFLNVVRPDGTVPLIGNTKEGAAVLPCDPALASTSLLQMYPLSGYAVANYGRPQTPASLDTPSQTVIAWANFATRAHKHDDEMSVLTWNGGSPLLTSSGYWPYGEKLLKTANSWRGSNAPFLEHEVRSELRKTTLVGYASNANQTFVDLIRIDTDSGASLRRQVITLGPNDWLIVDCSATKQPQALTSVWTLYPGWAVTPQATITSFVARRANNKHSLSISFASNLDLHTQTLSKSDDPFGGWVALDSAPQAITAATSIEVRGRSDAAVVSLWSLQEKDEQKAAHLQRWTGPTDWSICVDGEKCLQRIVRDGDRVQTIQGDATRLLLLQPAKPVSAGQDAINNRFNAAFIKFPYWRDFYQWRITATQLLGGLFVAQELVLLLLRRSRIAKTGNRRRILAILHSILLAGWCGIGGWIVFAYFGI